MGIYSERVSYALWKLNQSAIMWRKWRARLVFSSAEEHESCKLFQLDIRDHFLLLMLWRLQQYPLSLSRPLKAALSVAQGSKVFRTTNIQFWSLCTRYYPMLFNGTNKLSPTYQVISANFVNENYEETYSPFFNDWDKDANITKMYYRWQKTTK